MQPLPRLHPLILSQPRPIGAAGLSRCDSACPGRHPVQDGPVQIFVDDVVVGGHGGQPLSFNPCNLTEAAPLAHGGKIGALQ